MAEQEWIEREREQFISHHLMNGAEEHWLELSLTGRFVEPEIETEFKGWLAAKREAVQWNPIQTAPKDGTPIRICRPSDYDEDREHVVVWDEQDERWEVHDGKFFHVLRGDPPTGWLPIEASLAPGGEDD